MFAKCLTGEGIPHVGEPNGSSRYVGPSPDFRWQRSTKVKLAVFRCTAKYTVSPLTAAPLTPTTLEAKWYYYRDYGIPCLRARGFEPNSPLPPLADYVAGEGAWTFYPIEEDPNHMVAVEDFAACPEVPWKVLLNQ